MSTESTTTARPVKRFRIGFLSILQLILVVVIFLAVNFLSSQLYRPFDLSEDLDFTLSKSTARYLASENITEREDPIEMTVVFRADAPYYSRIRPIAEEYARLSRGKIKLRFVDPIRANDLAETLAAEYGIVFQQDLVIIDARSKKERETSTEKQVSPHVNIVRFEDMVVYKTDANNQRRVVGFLGQDALRAGLVGSIEGKPRKMWVLSDKSDLNAEGSDIWSVLRANLVSQNILPERVPLTGVDQTGINEIPDDVACVAIIAPAYDFTAEEIKLLDDYWKRPKSSILITTGEGKVPTRLRAFLRGNGITPRHDRVLTVKSGAIQTAVTSRFNSGTEFTRDLWEKNTIFEGTTQSLDVREGDNALLTKGITPLILIESWPAFWGESKFPADKVEFDVREDNPGPLVLAAAVIRGAPNDEQLAKDVSKMVVISNTGFLEPKNAQVQNLDFLGSCANWLVGREELTGEGPRSLRLYKLPILKPQVSFINRVNLVFLPCFALLIGLIVWSSRRS